MGQEISECPLKFIGDDLPAVNRILKAADFAERGMWPIAGGWQEQAAACVDGIQTVWAARAEIAARITKPL